jgi:hypothetical protein
MRVERAADCRGPDVQDGRWIIVVGGGWRGDVVEGEHCVGGAAEDGFLGMPKITEASPPSPNFPGRSHRDTPLPS